MMNQIDPNNTYAVAPESRRSTLTHEDNPSKDDDLRIMTFYLVEDSNVIRRSIMTKLKAISKRIQNAEWTFIEHPTVESILPNLSTFIDDQKSAVVIDENLDSQGGQLRGHELIEALISAGYAGLMISASGDEASALKHSECGAQIIWSKPLPRINRLLETLRIGWNLKCQVDPSVRFIKA
uniref:Response regulatory domain-containing protein n=2 Tax=Aureoumbra lagunensis TaxID=44058 RepID=A0A7S3JYW2_9STRA|mmetsp:Transcript_6609/g.9825  ORF Transcript_6609/g.9825 Transcript_6609/m.9825 type:complete len:181 (+) Transcript_6609:373-915(+)|eukprot:CAMPEP_0197300954 /NCGR_PEP_ID=MMETSP0890-20130614/49570_1 /TAXON_ID=44058 ORGANISM="Aureoumbra lagunensis, Strain CCMP1510" /NCGR_SAMPLE_ID=MMETSP0890 /ASSEMBLY_ACC=CAM_ASM_000533 /LENGTH=180 /DNA_ID=CAMNT_0042780075 /DNA_START=345 /DNA_END=887 /DNA_ORIENTATION=-